ncbi:Cytochrome P450 domain containing protein [Aphelenchoides fujianensis]|nr:Cytochrome P450 domain containing protein [Aphelenchoides fujianensis]
MLLPAIAALFVLLLVYNFHWKLRDLPPGPAPWPLVGNSAAFSRRPYAAFDEWRRRYGPVFTVWMGETPAVVFADFATIHETLVKQADTFAARFSLGAQSRLMRGGRFGILEAAGDRWREQQRFTLQTFRNFGMGRNLMEQKILAQTEELLVEMRAEQAANEAIDLPEMIERCVGSVICRMLFGHGFAKTDFLAYKRLLLHLGANFFDPAVVAACNVTGSKDHLRAMVLDLFLAGQDTTSNTLGFLVNYVLNHPEVGRRIERELAERIGSGRLIQTADRSALPYLNAVICRRKLH